MTDDTGREGTAWTRQTGPPYLPVHPPVPSRLVSPVNYKLQKPRGSMPVWEVRDITRVWYRKPLETMHSEVTPVGEETVGISHLLE